MISALLFLMFIYNELIIMKVKTVKYWALF
jgi:hypothetical protein